MVNALSVKDKDHKFSIYKQIIGQISNEGIFFENHEFYDFFSALFTKLKRDSLNLKKHEYEHIENTISELRRMFNPIKRAGFLKCLGLLLNTLFFLYFKHNQFYQSSFLLPMISNLDKVIDSCEPYSCVCICYYLGRLKVYNDELEDSCRYFTKAYELTTKFSLKRKIMKYLVIVKIRLRVFPTAEALNYYKLHDYVDFINSIKDGNYALYEKSCGLHKLSWIVSGIEFVLGDLESLLIRNLLKKIYLLQNYRIIKVEVIAACLNINRKPTFNNLNVMCLLASLINKGIVDGRIIFKAGVLRLSKENPFPLESKNE